MITVVIGTITALKGSVVITPSLMRKWRFNEGVQIGKPIEMELPISVTESDIDEFMEYVYGKLKAQDKDEINRTGSLRMQRIESGESDVREIYFSFKPMGVASSKGSFNRLVSEQVKGLDTYSLKMASTGTKSWIHETGTMIRLILLRWSTLRDN